MAMIAIIMPSRGLIFSETMEDVLDNCLYVDNYRIFFSNGRPIPEAFEIPTQQALNRHFTHIWYVEEDMILPNRILSKMINLDADVVSADYPVGSGESAITYKDGVPMYGGTGCLLIRTAVFKMLTPPYFETDTEYDTEGNVIGTKSEAAKAVMYGQHDIGLWMKFKELGIIPQIIDLPCGQRRLEALGQPGINTGTHKIREMWLK